MALNLPSSRRCTQAMVAKVRGLDSPHTMSICSSRRACVTACCGVCASPAASTATLATGLCCCVALRCVALRCVASAPLFPPPLR
jgi:hypothetical protein